MNPLLTRLTAQLKATGAKDPEDMAHGLLLNRGHINKDGSLTEAGQKRSDMGAAGRAIDRAVGRGDHKAKEYKYDAKTNRATLKRKP